MEKSDFPMSDTLTDRQLEKKINDWIDSCNKEAVKKSESHTTALIDKTLKKPLLIRVPVTLWEDIQKVTRLTGISMSATCIEILRPAIKNKLKELSDP